MVRIHRTLQKRAKNIDAEKVANDAEDYIYGYGLFKRELTGIAGLMSPARVKTAIKRIDDLEKEAFKLEDKIERLEERRAIEAAKLEQSLEETNEILGEYLNPEEMRDFWG